MSAILGVVIGAVLAGVFALVGATIQSRREQLRWLREMRYQAYAKLTAQYDFYSMVATSGEPTHEAFESIIADEAVVELLGPAEVVSAGDSVRNFLTPVGQAQNVPMTREQVRAHAAAYWPIKARFIEACRVALGVKTAPRSTTVANPSTRSSNPPRPPSSTPEPDANT